MELNLHKPLVFFDLETTGINLGTDRIVEFCFLKVMPDNTSKTWTQLVNPGIPIPKEATQIHGITDDDVKDKPPFKEHAHQLVQFIGNADLAGYNSIKFDIPILAEEFMRVEVDFDLKNRRFIDIMNIFHKMEPRNLEAAFKFYCSRTLEHAHSAEADTIATFEILKAQIERYQGTEHKDRFGKVTTPIVNDIQALSDFSYHTRIVDLAGHIIMDEKNRPVFNFGKHKGKPVEDVFRSDQSYYSWIMDADFPLYTKKIFTRIKLGELMA